MVWNYLTGFTNGQQLDLNFVKSLTGMIIERFNYNQPPVVKFIKPAYEYKFSGTVAPLVVINDKEAQTLAELQTTQQAIVARKKGADFTSVFCSLPLNGTDGFREIFREAGCHIYNEQNDFTYANSGLILLHTKDGGKRTIRLKNGKSVNFLPKIGTTLLIDAQSGEIVLK